MTPSADVRSPEPHGATPVAEHDRLHAWARDALYGSSGRLARAVRTAGLPASGLWSAIARRRWSRRQLEDPLPAPVVSVGNVTLGGTGKTPIVQWIARECVPEGCTVAVLSRGYGRAGSGTRIASPGECLDVVEFGDEPALHHRGGVWVGVGKSRSDAARAVAGRVDVDLFLLDDGLQTRVPRSLDVIVFSKRDLGAPARCVPAGPLRQPPDARPEDAVWISMEADPRSGVKKGTIADAFSGWWQTLPGVVGRWETGGTVPLDAWSAGEESALTPASDPVVVMSGVADPRSVVESARRAGWGPVAVEAFPDHHRWTQLDIERALGGYDPGLAVVLTEKDAVKCRSEWFGTRLVGVLRRVPVFDDPAILRGAVASQLDGVDGDRR